MPQCPQCGGELKEDFGLIDCPQCGVAVLINLDGSVSTGAEPQASVELPEIPEGQAFVQEELSQSQVILNLDQEVEQGLEQEVDQEFDSGIGEEIEQPPIVHTSMPEESSPEVPLEIPHEEPAFDDFSEPADEEPDNYKMFQQSTSDAKEASSDMSEIAEFANSEVSQGREGNLRYNIYISGIDSQETRSSLLESLTDKKFLWDAEAIMKEVDSGQLKIADVTAVKAFVLIDRIKGLSLDIKWEQYAIQGV